MPTYVLGIDAGTESIRTAIYDEQGICHGFGTSINQTIHERPGFAEQSVMQWKNSLIDSIRSAIRGSSVRPEEVSGISVAGTSCTVVFLDAGKKSLRRAIIWMDVRSIQQAERIASTKDEALKYVGFGEVSPEWFPCKVLWVKENEPEIYEKAHTVFEQTDWLVFMLTGEITANINTCSIRWFYDNSQGGFPRSLYNAVGLEDLFEKLPTRILPLGDVAGTLSKTIADKTGLPAGIPVAAGGADAFVGQIGVNALQQGKVALITGSSHLLIGLVEREIHARGIFGTYPDAVLPGCQVVEAGQISTGSVVKWFKDNFVGESHLRHTGTKVLSEYLKLNEGAEKIPLGSEGLIVVEHWQGNRTPWVDPSSRGVIRGLTLRHTPFHIFRAILEGVCYGTAVILNHLERVGVTIQEMVACGGSTESQLWMQIHADVTGKKISIPEEQQAVSLGCAILATVVAGTYSSIKEAAERMVRIRTVIEPDLTKTEEYRFYVDQYVRTYECLKEESRAVVKKLEQSQGR